MDMLIFVEVFRKWKRYIDLRSLRKETRVYSTRIFHARICVSRVWYLWFRV